MSPTSSLSKPSIFSYLDYRSFLQDYVTYLKSRGEYSTRKFAQMAGFKGNSFVSLVVKGKRNISFKSLRKISTGLRLSENESLFLEQLVKFTQGKSFEEKESAYRDILKSKKFQRIHAAAQAEYDYFSHWYIIAILEALGTKWGQLTPTQMASSLGITETELADALHLLARLKLIEKNATGWVRSHETLQTPNNVKSIALRTFHKEMINKAAESLDKIATEERSIAAVTIPLSKKSFSELKEKVLQFQKELGVFYSDDSEPENVYQFNIQVFPLVSLKTSDEAE